MSRKWRVPFVVLAASLAFLCKLGDDDSTVVVAGATTRTTTAKPPLVLQLGFVATTRAPLREQAHNGNAFISN